MIIKKTNLTKKIKNKKKISTIKFKNKTNNYWDADDFWFLKEILKIILGKPFVKATPPKKPTNLDLNIFFQKIFLKKQYIRQLKNNKITLLNNIKKNKHKVLNSELFKISNNFPIKKVSEVSYVLDFSFSKTNTTLHVMDCSGKTKFFYSAGLFDFKGNQKTFQSDAILKKFYKILISDLSFLKFSKIAIHFKNKNINYKISWFLKKLREKFFIAVVKFFTVYPFNGCRRKKQKRKKFKTMKKRRYG